MRIAQGIPGMSRGCEIFLVIPKFPELSDGYEVIIGTGVKFGMETARLSVLGSDMDPLQVQTASDIVADDVESTCTLAVILSFDWGFLIPAASCALTSLISFYPYF